MMESVTLILAAFLTSTLSAVIGMGGGVTLLAIMAMVMPDGYLVVAYHGIIQLVSNATRTTVYRNEINLPLLARFSKGIIPGLFAAAGIVYGLIQYFDVSSASELKIDFLKPLIGIYIIWFLYLRKKNPISDKSFLWMGGISGLVTVFVGAAGPLIAPFFISRDMKKQIEFIPTEKKDFDNKWEFITGNKKEIYNIARMGYFVSASEGDGGEEDFIHSPLFVLVDKERHIRGYYDGTDSLEVGKLLVDIDVLLVESSKKNK